jgi:hypothetical protein
MGDHEPRSAFFVLGYSGFRGFPALKIQTWETTKRSRPHSLAKISQENLYFDTEVFLRAKDSADSAPLFLSAALQWDNEKQL